MSPRPLRNAVPRGPRRAGGVVVGVAAAVAACSPVGPGSRDDGVLLLSVDTVSADRVACYGYPDARTPMLDRLARAGLQVVDAVSPAPLTLPSHATMLCGVDPPAHGARENGLFVVPESLRTVPERLPAGTPCGAFVGAFPLAARFGLAQGFDPYEANFRGAGDRRRPPERRAADVLALAAGWIESLPRNARPFLWAHVYDPHYPYAPPEPWPRIARTRAGAGAQDGEIAYVDRETRRFLHRLERNGRRLKVLVAADHGEALGRHGELSHGLFVYDETQRVPMIWSGPGVAARLEPDQRPLRDVAATLVAAFGGDLSDLAATSLDLPATEEHAYVETKHTELMRGWAPLHGMRTTRWKYVRAPRPELYDLARDPGELDNVLDANADVVADLSDRVDAALAAEAGTAPTRLDERTAEQLRALGYVAAIGDPGTADVRKDPKDGAAGAAALFLGEEAYLRGDLREAERRFLETVRLDPAAKEAYAFLSGTYMSVGRASEAADAARTALRLEPHLNEAPIHATLGEALLALDRPAEAIPHLKIAQAAARGSTKVAKMLADAEARSR